MEHQRDEFNQDGTFYNPKAKIQHVPKFKDDDGDLVNLGLNHPSQLSLREEDDKDSMGHRKRNS